jgi:3alpha(or 20beta)-hydroxysteroid dehydrogenase
MMRRLEGKTAIITGAAGGIGAATARLFVAEGANVVLTDLQESGASIAHELGSSAVFLTHDVSDKAVWAKVVETALSRFGRLDVLVNNAGFYNAKPMLESSPADLERSFQINALGAIYGMQAAIEALRASGAGSIINIASGVAIRHVPGTFPYSTSKWAVRGVSGCAAAELGRMGVRVNAIFPGLIQTAMLASNSQEVIDHQSSMVPLGRIGQPEEVAQVIAFFASDGASYVNGAELIIDGGVML